MEKRNDLPSFSLKDSTLWASGAGIALIGPDVRITGANPSFCRFLGYGEEELINHCLDKILLQDEKAAGAFACSDHGRLGGNEATERRFFHRDGAVKWGLVSGGLFSTGDAAAPCQLMIVQDITEKKLHEMAMEKTLSRLKSQLQELTVANQELESFNYTVSHDLRSPLTTIRGFCELLLGLGKQHLDEQCKSIIRHMSGTVRHMDQLIESLLHFSLISKKELQRGPVDLGRLATTIAVQLKMREPYREVDFRIVEKAQVEGDAKLLREVLENLLGNAWKYTGKMEGAFIEFGTCEISNKTTYFVRDNGPGFEMSNAEALFIPFHRLHSREDFAGYGIGLSTAQRIVLRHGGKIWAEGEPGKGATFFFTLS